MWFDDDRSSPVRLVQVYSRNSPAESFTLARRRGVPRFHGATPLTDTTGDNCDHQARPYGDGIARHNGGVAFRVHGPASDWTTSTGLSTGRSGGQRYFTATPDFWPAHWTPSNRRTGIGGSGGLTCSRSPRPTRSIRELHTAVAAYVWGVGKWAFLVGRQVRAFTRNRDCVESKLRTVARTLADDEIAGGGSSTSRCSKAERTTCRTWALRTSRSSCSSSGTRSPPPDGLRPLILDRRVATALRNREVLALGDSGWSTDDYERYLVHCHQTSPDNPEAVEIELFNAGSPS